MRTPLASLLFFSSLGTTLLQSVHSLPVESGTSRWSTSSSSSDDTKDATSSSFRSGGHPHSPASVSATPSRPLLLHDIPPEGIDVMFKMKKHSQRQKKDPQSMRDPSRTDAPYREKLPNESQRLYERRKAALLAKKAGLQRAKEAIFARHSDDQIKAEEAWQAYIRHRGDQRRYGNQMLIVRKKMAEQGILHPSASKHVKVEEKAAHLYRVSPMKRKADYMQNKKRQDRYRARLKDPSFVPSNTNSKRKEIEHSDDSDYEVIRKPAKRPRTVGRPSISENLKEVNTTEEILGFKVERKKRTIRQPV